MTFILNPGSGPVEGATIDHAMTNIAAFAKEASEQRGVVFAYERQPALDEDGRYCFRLFIEGEEHHVEIPGVPLEKVRFLDGELQNAWHFPRLYVDGSSWLWKYALNAVCRPEED